MSDISYVVYQSTECELQQTAQGLGIANMTLQIPKQKF